VNARTRVKHLVRGRRISSPLVCPLAVGQAAEIDALPVEDFLADATKLSKGVQALHAALGTDVIVTADGEVVGDAAVEATRRLAATVDDVAIGAALPEPDLTVARPLLEAGAHLLLLVAGQPLADGEAWRAAATTIANLARFHQAVPVAVFADEAEAKWAPRGAVVCLPEPAEGQGLAFAPDLSGWRVPSGVPVVTTLGPVQGSFADVCAAVRS
jgi:hypothetical protein